MNYFYYPGCSLEASAKEYDIATRALMAALGAELTEIEEWTCCGATAAESTSYLLSLALPARTLALAEQMEPPGQPPGDILVPCSACYLNLKKAQLKATADPALLNRINEVLAVDQLQLAGRLRVRHLLDVLSRDVGAERLQPLVKHTLGGLKVAPYYGCQCLRPYPVFDNPEQPQSMFPLIEATGASVWNWTMGAKCCGASNMNTKTEVAVELVGDILNAARGADAIVTVCPMCQMNLEAYQRKVSRTRHQDLQISILYLPQLLNAAMGLSRSQIRLDLNLALDSHLQRQLTPPVRVDQTAAAA